MQFKSSIILAAGLVASAAAQTVNLPTTAIPTDKLSSIFSHLSSDFSSYSAAQSTIAPSLASAITAALESITDDVPGVTEPTIEALSDFASQLNSIITGTPTWLAELPTDVQSYIKSVATAEASIINKDVNAGNRVDAMLKAGTAAVVGIAVGVAVML